MDTSGMLEALRNPDRARGDHTRSLRLAGLGLVFEGLDEALAAALDRRWGGFVTRGAESDVDGQPPFRIVVSDIPADPLPPIGKGESYRIEGELTADGLLVRSYSFAVWDGTASDEGWHLGLADHPDEPIDRAFENAARFLVARRALDAGGIAVHGAGVLKYDRAWLFVGPSNSGKTTAVGLSDPAVSLGDDFAVALPGNDGWQTLALPFDNLECAPADPPAGRFKLAGMWRLFKGPAARVQELSATTATASLLGCAAFPWAMPDRTAQLLERAQRLVCELRYEHLYFRKAPDFWSVLHPG